jgi:hypothetical protein
VDLTARVVFFWAVLPSGRCGGASRFSLMFRWHVIAAIAAGEDPVALAEHIGFIGKI